MEWYVMKLACHDSSFHPSTLHSESSYVTLSLSAGSGKSGISAREGGDDSSG